MRYKIILLGLFLGNLNFLLYNTLEVAEAVKNIIRGICIILFFISFILDIKSIEIKKVDILFIFLSLFSILTFTINTNILNFMYIILLLIVTRIFYVEKLIKNNYQIMIIIFIISIIFLLIGITTNNEIIAFGRVRNTFGFKNVNSFSSLVYSFLMLFYLEKKKLNFVEIIMFVSLGWASFVYTDTRTSLFAIIIFVILDIGYKYLFKSYFFKKYKLVLKLFTYLLAILPMVFSFISPFLLENYPTLDELTSRRLFVFTKYINNNSSYNLIFGGTKSLDIDNGYLSLLYSLGLPFFIFMVVTIFKAINYMFEINSTKYIAFIISFLFFNALESMFIRPELAISIVFWFIIYRMAYDSDNHIIEY